MLLIMHIDKEKMMTRDGKRTAIDFAAEWCRVEAPSPISIMRECLRNLERPMLAALLNGEMFKVEGKYHDEISTFFSEIIRGNGGEGFRCENGKITIQEKESELLRNYFARRLNFLEVVAAAFNSELADRQLITQFFGGIIFKNPSYRTAVEIDRTAWPELAQFIYSNTRNGK
ncbi:hypothetical protein ACFQAT_08545 [Undibacterium arcticum]|uniref:hypothetical protein n=1 Tax=Undibacterium arcticum TaxID=1762892 RepID=UPI003624211C